MAEILKVENLKTYFKLQDGLVKAVDGISFSVNEGEVLGIVGESGSGKSMTCRSILRLIPEPGKIIEGKIIYKDQNIMDWSESQLNEYRGKEVSMILQEPMTALNPVWTVGDQMIETLMEHEGLTQAEAKARSIDLLRLVGIPVPERRINEYPHQFSGGMRQRAMIAMGLSCNPKLIIADEPTTALDVTTQAVLLELMKELVDRFDTSLVLVTHNLGVVARYAQRIYVMYAGRIVEAGPTKAIFANPRHPYTVGLLKSVPRLDQPRDRKLVPIEGLPPNLIRLPPTCAFLPRCPYAIRRCERSHWPPLAPVREHHLAACFVNLEEKALDVNGK